MSLSAFKQPGQVKRRQHRLGMLLGLCLLLAQPAFGNPLELAAADRFRVQVFSLEDGLPQTTPTALLQSRDGYLWATTFGGLVRFNGMEFTVFDLANTNSLASNRLTALHEDSRGTLWIGHERGGLTRYENGEFSEFLPARQLPAAAVSHIASDGESHLWLRLEGGQLARCNSAECGLYPLDADAGRVYSLLRDSRGHPWLGTDAGLRTLSEGNWVPAVRQGNPGPQRILDLREGIDGTLLLVTTTDIVRFDGEQYQRLYQHQGDYGIRSALEDRRGNLWVGTAASLLFLEQRADRPGDPLYHPPLRLDPAYFDSLIWSLMEDREGSIWVGTQGHGLAQLVPNVIRRYSEESGLFRRELVSVVEDGSGTIWVGASCGSPVMRMAGERFLPIEMPGVEGYPCLYALHFDMQGRLWAGLTSGIARYDGNGWMHFPLPGGDDTGPVRAIYQSDDGLIWVGTEHAGVFSFDGVTFTRLMTRDGLAHNDVRFITQDRQGQMWFGTEAGVSRLARGVFSNLTPADGLAGGTVRSIYEDADGVFWIGTYGGGLSRIADGRITRITEAEGLFENVVSQILEDNNDNLWMLGNRSIFFVNRRRLNDFAEGRLKNVTSIAFTQAENMVEGSGGTQPAGWRQDSGNFWFTTMDGLAHVDLDAFELNRAPPPVVIESVIVDGQLQSNATRLEIPAGTRNIEIHYAGLSFLQQDRMQFRYRLTGHDQDWQEVGNRRIAFYSGIAPGEYTFEVYAANSHGFWNDQGAGLALAKAAFFYETRTFFAAIILMLMVAAYGANAVRNRRIGLHNAELEAMNCALAKEIRERQKAETALAERNQALEEANLSLEASNKELQRFSYTVSHDLKSPLVTIKGFLQLLEREAVSGRQTQMIEDIRRIARAADHMSRLLDELLELSRMGRLLGPPENLSPVTLAGLAVENLAEAIRERRIRVQIAEDMPDVRGDRARLLQVFQNLVENAVKFMGDNTEPLVEIGAEQRGGEVRCFVRDNGIGMAPGLGERVFELFERGTAEGEGTGIGLTLVRRIVELHGGKAWLKSAGPGLGTTVYFTLPAVPAAAAA